MRTRPRQTKLATRIGQVCRLAFLALILGSVIPGCATLRGRAPSRIYGGALVEVRRLDTSSLRGKRIVLDPGHGGAFPGAIGSGGLKESDVNLGVALYLWGMLRDAGADVLLTRSSDVDFLEKEKAGLRDDLTGRVDVALAFEPELFVSLHHNADVSRSRKRNQIETYFKMLDDGPSMDVAKFINRRLSERLGIPKSEVIPGNYFVLRNMPCTAVLGEPSYLSNPWVEEKLKLAEKQLLEAQAYFLGILDYFSRGVPLVASVSPRDTVLADGQPKLSAVLRGEKSAVDTSSVTVKVDGVPVVRSVELGGELVRARPEKPLSSGRHELCVSCRNLNGNSSAERCFHFEVSLPPRSLTASASPDCVSGKGGVLITAVSEDENGNPVMDGTKIEFSGEHGVFSSDSVTTLAGMATSVFFSNYTANEGVVRVNYRSLVDPLVLTDSLMLKPCPAAKGVSTQALRVVADDTGEPLWNTRLSSWSGDSLFGFSSPQGLIVFDAKANGRAILTREGFLPAPVWVRVNATPVPPGYGQDRDTGQTISMGTRDLLTVRMKTAAAGVLRNAKIVIDVGRTPRREEQARSVSRKNELSQAQLEKETPGPDVAARLKAMLTGAGAQVLVLDETVSDEKKVKMTELFGARMYLRIEGSPQKSVSLLHYPGSTAGTRLAQEIARWWGQMLKTREPSVKEDAHYVLRQTSCPALIAVLPTSDKHTDRRSASMIAYALFLGMLEDFGLERDQLAELDVTIIDNVPRETLEIELDDFISLSTSTEQSVTFFCEEGTHLARTRSRDGKTALEFVSLKKGTQTGLDLNPR